MPLSQDAQARLLARLDAVIGTDDWNDGDRLRFFEVIETEYDPRDERDVLLERLRATPSGKDTSTLGVPLSDLRTIVARAEATTAEMKRPPIPARHPAIVQVIHVDLRALFPDIAPPFLPGIYPWIRPFRVPVGTVYSQALKDRKVGALTFIDLVMTCDLGSNPSALRSFLDTQNGVAVILGKLLLNEDVPNAPHGPATVSPLSREIANEVERRMMALLERVALT